MLHWEIDEVEDGPLKQALEAARRFTVVDAQRVRVWTLASSVALTFSRRLGADATRDEMVRDKLISRKMCHMYYQIWSMMYRTGSTKPPPPWGQWDFAMDDDQIRRIGSTVVWKQQVVKLVAAVELRMSRIEEYSEAPTPDLQRWFNKRRATLEWELQQLTRIQEQIR